MVGEIIYVHTVAQTQLFQVVDAIGPLGLRFGPGQSRQEQRCQNRNDGDDDQQLDQGKTMFPGERIQFSTHNVLSSL
jgi:hypothetical protein